MRIQASLSMKETPMAVVSARNYEGGSGGEFVVHTQHFCDKCFQRPIFGQRYTSDANSNFNLCAHCFETFTGQKIGFTETASGKSAKLHCFVIICGHVVSLCDRFMLNPYPRPYFVVRDKKISNNSVIKLKIENSGEGKRSVFPSFFCVT